MTGDRFVKKSVWDGFSLGLDTGTRSGQSLATFLNLKSPQTRAANSLEEALGDQKFLRGWVPEEFVPVREMMAAASVEASKSRPGSAAWLLFTLQSSRFVYL